MNYHRILAAAALAVTLPACSSPSSNGDSLSFEWAVSAGITKNSKGSSIAVDGSGNSYIAGFFSGTATFGGTTVTSNGGEHDIFVAKLDRNGKFLWAISAGGPFQDYGNAIAVDADGNSYVTGTFVGTATFGKISLSVKDPALMTEELFLAKVDKHGKYVWVIGTGADWAAGGYGIAVDDHGSCYVTGYFQGTATLGGVTLTSRGPNSHDVLVAKVNSAGKVLWAVLAGGISEDVGRAIAVDGAGNSHVTGYFQGEGTFGSTTLTSKGFADAFVAKVDSAGKFVSAVPAGGTAKDNGISVAVDSLGNSYITDSYKDTPVVLGSTTMNSKGFKDIFVAKLDSGNKFVWAVSAGGTSDDWGRSIAVDGLGNSYVTGFFRSTATFGSTTLTSKGSYDIFVAKLDSAGNYVSAISAGGTGSDVGWSIAVDRSGSSYVTGDFSGTSILGSTTLTANNASDIFVAKLDSSAGF